MRVKLGSLPIAITAFSAVMVIVSAVILLNNYVLTEWERASAHVSSSEISTRLVRANQSSVRVFRVCINYEYSVGNLAYSGRDCGILGDFPDRSDAVAAKDNFFNDSNQLIDILYNVEKPDESIVESESRFQKVWLLFGASLAILLFQITRWLSKYRR